MSEKVQERKKATIQDDSREAQIALHCGLEQVIGRAGVDARDQNGYPYELKSATKRGISTARDVGLHTIEVWRKRYWIIAIGSSYVEEGGYKRFEITALYIAHPDHLDERFSQLEQTINNRLAPCEEVLKAAQAAGVKAEILQKCRSVIERGITLNNPKISIRLIEKNATRLDEKNPSQSQEQIQEFVTKFPLKR